jgi:hypothetical protein
MTSRKSKKMEDTRLFAFWRYDLFPHICGGTVTEMLENGRVATVEYGAGSYFNPFKILPIEAGKRIMAKLKALEGEHRAAETKLNKEFDARRREVIDW